MLQSMGLQRVRHALAAEHRTTMQSSVRSVLSRPLRALPMRSSHPHLLPVSFSPRQSQGSFCRLSHILAALQHSQGDLLRVETEFLKIQEFSLVTNKHITSPNHKIYS